MFPKQLCNVIISFVMSVCLQGTIRLSLAPFSYNFILGFLLNSVVYIQVWFSQMRQDVTSVKYQLKLQKQFSIEHDRLRTSTYRRAGERMEFLPLTISRTCLNVRRLPRIQKLCSLC